jgi:hypothetical protein
MAMLTLAVAVTVALPSAVLGQEPPKTISIEEYAQSNSMAGMAAKQFVVMRCAALYAFMAEAAQAASDNPLADALFKVGGRFLGIAIRLENNTASTFPQDQIVRMAVIYAGRAAEAKARTGNWSDDPLIRSDGDFCRIVAEQFK